MTPRIIFIVAASWGILSCTTSADSGRASADVSGVYVREFAYEISNPETGKKLGMRQVRDSIFIDHAENGYQVSNRKWRMNDYDQEGWTSMAHAESRPFVPFRATFEQRAQQLIPDAPANLVPIVIDQDRAELFRDAAKLQPYRKVE